MANRILSTVRSDAATLVDTEGNPYPVQPEAGPTPPSGVIPPLYSVVLRPGDTSGADNVFTTWGALYAACAGIAGGVRVTADDTLGAIVIPAGTYSVDGWEFTSQADFANASGGSLVTLSVGVHFTGASLKLTGFVLMTGALTTPLITANSEYNLVLNELAQLMSTGAGAVLEVSGANAFAFVVLDSSAVLGDGTHAAVTCSAGASAAINVYSGVLAASAVGTAGVTIVFDSSASISASSQFAGTSFVQRSDAGQEAYTPANVSKWNGSAPASVADALDRIAAQFGPIL